MNKRFANAAFVLIGVTLIASAAARAAESEKETAPRLILEIRDEGNGERTPARFSLSVNGTDYHPGELNSHGLVFTSVHESRRQVQTITYARGTGPVELTLPKEAHRVEVRVAKGFEYLPAAIAREVTSAVTRVEVSLVRWANLGAEGWFAADAHLHYDRLDPAADRDWFTMLAGDDLSHAHFMTAKGGQVPGEWARQYAYGAAGEGFDGERLLTAGEEYRDTAQGHINLMGLREIIQPIMAGTGKSPNYPPLNTVLLQTRELGGMPGAAHGGSLGRNPTVILDTVLGALDFMEIGNSHLYALENWYRLMNCGFHLPPTAGTDLPNFPDRDAWQPFLGGMRMYLKMDGGRDFKAWKETVRSGKVFVSSGPILSFRVNGVEMGGIVEARAGDEITLEAEAASPVGLRMLEIVRNGEVLPAAVERSEAGGVHRLRARVTLRMPHSGWLAARAEGVAIQALHRAGLTPLPWHKRDAVAHSAAVRVIVDGKPIRSPGEATALKERLSEQRSFYETSARYANETQRKEMLALFDRAIEELKRRGAQP